MMITGYLPLYWQTYKTNNDFTNNSLATIEKL